MDLFTYLMAKNGNNTSVHGDLFSYLLGKGQSQTQTISGVTIYIPNAKKLVSFMMTKESTQATSILPEGYTQIDYIESHGTEFIDTNFKATNKTIVEAKLFTTNYTNKNWFGGSANDYKSFIFNANGTNSIEYQYGTSIRWYNPTIEQTVVNAIFKVKYGLGGLYINDNQIATLTTSDFTDTLNLCLFVRNGGTANIDGRIYYFKIFEDDVLIRDFIPCYRNSDNEVGLYDLVNDVFYTNQGTGAFTYGSVAQLPNPDYPIEVKTVKGYEKDGNNWVDVKVQGKNLFDKNNYDYVDKKRLNNNGEVVTDNDSSYSITLFKVKPNTIYSIQGTQSAPGKSTRINFYDNNKQFLSRSSPYQSDSYSFTTPVNCFYIGLQLRNSTYINLDIIQLEEGLVTSYEPYQSTTISIPLNGNELVGIGDYKDELIVDKTGHVYLNKKIEKKTLDGSENWSLQNSCFVTSYFNDIKPTPAYADRNQKLIISNYFQWQLSTYRGSVTDLHICKVIDSVYSKQIAIRYDAMSGVTTNFTTWLSNNNPIIYYALETPDTIDLNTTVDLRLFKGVNNITNSEDGYMTIQYR